MITNKERVAQLIEQIKRLETLTEEIRERDIYPVSYFSQAFDMTGKIQESLQQIEIYQIELFERQQKEHQAYILSTVQQSTPTVIPVIADEIVPAEPEKQEEEVKKSGTDQRKSDYIDLKKIITLNDRFLFCRELFANDENLMNQTINELNKEDSFEASIDYLYKRFKWNWDDKYVDDFVTVLKNRFL